MSKTLINFSKKWFDSHKEISVEQKVIWIHDLYQNYTISEKEEEELYSYVDPDDKIDCPADLWYEDFSVNELAKAIENNGIRETTSVREACEDITWDNNPQSVDVYFINRSGEPDSTQFDLHSWNKVKELEGLWLDQCNEIFDADADSVTDIVLYSNIQG